LAGRRRRLFRSHESTSRTRRSNGMVMRCVRTGIGNPNRNHTRGGIHVTIRFILAVLLRGEGRIVRIKVLQGQARGKTLSELAERHLTSTAAAAAAVGIPPAGSIATGLLIVVIVILLFRGGGDPRTVPQFIFVR
jgi:hypothetical protein